MPGSVALSSESLPTTSRISVSEAPVASFIASSAWIMVALISASFDLAKSSNCSRYFWGQYSRSCDSLGPMWVSEDTRIKLSTPGGAPGFSCMVATITAPPYEFVDSVVRDHKPPQEVWSIFALCENQCSFFWRLLPHSGRRYEKNGGI